MISHLCLPGNRNLNQIIITENEMHHREKIAKCYTKFRMLKEHSGINSLWFPLNEIILCTYGPQSSKVKDLPYLLLDSHALSRLPRGWCLFFFCLTFGLLLIRLIKDPQSSPKSHFSRYFLMTLFPPSYGDFSVYINENIKKGKFSLGRSLGHRAMRWAWVGVTTKSSKRTQLQQIGFKRYTTSGCPQHSTCIQRIR